MRVVCENGYYRFYPKRSSEVFLFCDYFNFALLRKGNYYTFPFLVNAPDHSIITKPYLNLLANALYEGNPWEVMGANRFVYNINSQILVPLDSVSTVIELIDTGDCFVPDVTMIQAGSLNRTGRRIKSFDSFFHQAYLQLRVVGVEYD